MKVNSRTGKAVRNTFVTLACQIVYLLVSFACRTVFTNLLGSEYLGVNGLFSNILTMLSFAELGIGSALVYRMYSPLAHGDKNKIRQYLLLYKRIYNVILLVIAVVGVALIPFLKYLVQAPDVQEDVRLLYLLYLADTLISYVYVYRKSLLIADQNDYIVSIYTQIFNIIMNIAQIVLLLFTRNFIMYCLIRSSCNLLNNIACSYHAKRRYPYIKEPVEGKLSRDEIKGLKKDVKGLLFTKIASTAFSGTDNIFISAYMGLKYVGILSNYTLLLDTFNGVMNKIFYSVTASIGNLNVSGSSNDTEKVLRKMFFLNSFIYGYLCLGMMILIREFITQIWFTPEYELSQVLVTVMMIELFLRSIHFPLHTTRNALGCFSEYKVWFAALAVLNIILDFILVKPFGITGLYIATIIGRGGTYILDIRVVYKMQFKKSMFSYLKLVFVWLAFLGVCGLIMSQVVARITFGGIPGFALKILIISIIYMAAFLLAFHRTEEFAYYRGFISKLFKRKKVN